MNSDLVYELKSKINSIYCETEKTILDKVNSTEIYFNLKAKNETVAEEYRSNKVALYINNFILRMRKSILN